MAKAFATKNTTVNLNGVIEIEDKTIYISNQDGESKPLIDFLESFDNREVTLSVKEVVNLA